MVIYRTMQYLLFVGKVTSDWLSKDDKASHIVPGCIAIKLFSISSASSPGNLAHRLSRDANICLLL